MQTIREFAPADRYLYDFGLCSYDNGFAQIDTRQDASYYGTWCSPTRRMIVNYAEGDVTTHIAETDDEFVQALRELVQWSDEAGHGPTRIDPGFADEMRQAFTRLGLGDLLH
jgi:hypothetical protein